MKTKVKLSWAAMFILLVMVVIIVFAKVQSPYDMGNKTNFDTTYQNYVTDKSNNYTGYYQDSDTLGDPCQELAPIEDNIGATSVTIVMHGQNGSA